MVWKIEFTLSAEREFAKLPFDVKKRIRDYLRNIISIDPRSSGKTLTAPVKLWRYRIGDYRVICQIKDADLVVLVIRIGPRDQIYKKLN